mmetsp:Transcript_12936/g.30491  ORF Transcript_12936/g.30491 Transcript_12936/m.30491 type:complete len:201 (-) Transcript_12936:124-726(-)
MTARSSRSPISPLVLTSKTSKASFSSISVKSYPCCRRTRTSLNSSRGMYPFLSMSMSFASISSSSSVYSEMTPSSTKSSKTDPSCSVAITPVFSTSTSLKASTKISSNASNSSLSGSPPKSLSLSRPSSSKTSFGPSVADGMPCGIMASFSVAIFSSALSGIGASVDTPSTAFFGSAAFAAGCPGRFWSIPPSPLIVHSG